MRERLTEIEDRISRAAASCGRERSDIQLIAVSKTVCPDQIKAAYDLGLRHFGESRLQEALAKIEALPEDIVWHFIGTLQSNKAKKVSQSFDVIHTLETESQLTQLAKGLPIDCLIEINIGNEGNKSGLLPQKLAPFHQLALQCKSVQCRGLMCIGPMNPNPEFMRPFFRRMRELNDQIGGQWLSMGMSNDFEVAIQEGATHIRVGSALFGERARQ